MAARRAAASFSAVVVLSGCSGAPPIAEVDGGTPEVALLGEVVVSVKAGDVVTIRHVSAPNDGDQEEEAPLAHAFVGGAGEQLPPIFMGADSGLVPNGGVWGACRGGDAAGAGRGCPIPPVEGPAAWNGVDYWSTGAMVPGESREVPVADTIAAGDHSLVCVLHPELRVVLRVNGPAPEAPVRDVDVAIAEALTAAAVRDQELKPGEVLAGVVVGDAYVARFVPETISVPRGATVTWRAGARTPVDVVFGSDAEELSLVHTDPADGNASGDAAAWDGEGVVRSGFLSSEPSAGARGQQWSLTFTQAGTYSYASRFGPTLKGTVVVTDE